MTKGENICVSMLCSFVFLCYVPYLLCSISATKILWNIICTKILYKRFLCYGKRLTYVCYDKYIYVMDIDKWQCRGNLTLSAGANKNTWLYIICYNLFTAGGVLLQGEFSSTQVVIIKKGENVEAYQVERFWWWTSISTTLWLFYLCCKFWVFLCNFRILWNALNTHTNTFISRLDFLV